MNPTAAHPLEPAADKIARPAHAGRYAAVLFAALWFIGVAALIVWFWPKSVVIPRLTPVETAAAVPPFTLVDHRGEQITLSDLLGKVWVADFVFTRCSGPCPTLSHHLASLQYEFADQPDLKLVTFTLDPVNDTPQVMAEYARRFHADPSRWLFLTGHDEKAMHELVEKGFLQSVQAATDNAPIIHSTYFVVVDRAGRMRSFHDGLDRNSRAALIAAVKALLAEPPGA